MGDEAEHLTQEGLDEWAAHVNETCGADCPCRYCEGEEEPPEEVAVVPVEPATPALVQPRGISPFDLDPEIFQAGLDRRKKNRQALLDWIADALIKGTDFGEIHVVGRDKCQAGNRCTNPYHFSRPVLFKPGAEKICSMLGLTPRYPGAEEYEAKALRGEPIDIIILRCQLVSDSGQVVAEGMGARSVTGDKGDINKALKMSEKSGLVNATLKLGLSDSYTQDLDDMVADGKIEGTPVSEDTKAHLGQAKANREAAGKAYVREREGSPTDQDHETPAEPEEPPKVASQWGDIGECEIAPKESCKCGSQVIRRKTRDGRVQITCELNYRGFLKQVAAVEMLAKLKAKEPELKHFYRMEAAA